MKGTKRGESGALYNWIYYYFVEFKWILWKLKKININHKGSAILIMIFLFSSKLKNDYNNRTQFKNDSKNITVLQF